MQTENHVSIGKIKYLKMDISNNLESTDWRIFLSNISLNWKKLVKFFHIKRI